MPTTNIRPTKLTFPYLCLCNSVFPSNAPMASLTRLFKPQSSSLILLFNRSLSTNTCTLSYINTDHPKGGVKTFHWVFLGCPGVGKGTYASRLSTLLGIPHIATGDLVRQELSSSGPLSHQLDEVVNKGKLVSDEIMFNLLSNRLEAGESREIDLVVNLRLREDVLIEKCLGRRICSECGKGFNVASISAKPENGMPGMSMPPLLPPQQCASKLITRADDTEPVVRERLRVYKEKTEPVEDYYRKQGKLLEFDLPGGILESWPKLLETLNLDDYHHKKSAAG
ncbi:hypothetical protein M8C21_016918 [Ambrosia artemisiifolia]|uniref:adenylate kinase n=1 Tax=Ambrosia artemisiifolia TaxID=4212 RepID=A0AAD5D3X6_AMBAR|nr:hypothetical protein M8C21_016918 [Ambrosia artemisiifolia]